MTAYNNKAIIQWWGDKGGGPEACPIYAKKWWDNSCGGWGTFGSQGVAPIPVASGVGIIVYLDRMAALHI